MSISTAGGPLTTVPSTLPDSSEASEQSVTGPVIDSPAAIATAPALMTVAEDGPAASSPVLEPRQEGALNAHTDARAIVRLVQCSQCSLPLQNPLTLPCGNSLCRKCLPELHQREYVSYPALPDRREGFTCPFAECKREHSVADCSPDVTLAKVMAVVAKEISEYRSLTSESPLLLEEVPDPSPSEDSSDAINAQNERTAIEYRQPRSRVLSGGRLVATYTLAEMGELLYSADVNYYTLGTGVDDYSHLDVAILEQLKEATRQELDCHVCYNIMLDPLTTTCGHTFCRACLQRVLDHSTICPICRRTLATSPALSYEPNNTRLSALLNALCPDLIAQRASSLSNSGPEDAGLSPTLTTPLFVCTLSYPSMPTFLHIFEPRYRLMIRRAIESGDRKFGMMMYNRHGAEQGDLGATQFMQYGTLLHIISVQMLPDGRSLIETVGVSRFRVRSWDFLDGYTVGAIERVDDISVADEERAEIAETSQASTAAESSSSATESAASTTTASPTAPTPTADRPSTSSSTSSTSSLLSQIDTLSTSHLHQICTSFIQRMRASSAPWLHERVMAAYGPPPTDPALFPYWFASILPIADEEKYRLLPSCSVRGRLKICARWVGRIEGQRWSTYSSCTVV